MTRFDAGLAPRTATDSPSVSRSDSPSVTARGIVARQPAVVAVSTIVAAVLITAACGLLLAGQAARHHLARTMDALQLTVFLRPELSRADAESLRDRIAAVPAVSSARLRPREVAMSELAGSGAGALSTRTNPLPDAWIVSLAAAANEAANPPSLAARVANTRLALEAIPGVEAVRVDARWVEWLDRASAEVGRGTAVVDWTVSTALLATLLGVFFVTGRALSSGTGDGHRMQALATVGMVTGLLAIIATAGAIVLAMSLSPILDAVGKPIAESIGRTDHLFVVGMGLAVVLVAALGHLAGGSRR